MADRKIIVGIDEAGYGPVLGPMVVSAAVFETPGDIEPTDLWSLLERAIHRPGSGRAGAGAAWLGDSKAVYSPAIGLRRLETSVLAFARLAGADTGRLLRLLPDLLLEPEIQASMADYPWYSGRDMILPVDADANAINAVASGLRTVLSEHSVELLGVRCAPLLVSDFNDQIDRTDNKATVLFDQSAALMRWVMEQFQGRPVHILADRQGGRKRYETLLDTAFEGALLSTLKETPEESAYLLYGCHDQLSSVGQASSTSNLWLNVPPKVKHLHRYSGARRATIRFCVKGDARYLPTALASMFSKYLRELLMRMFNSFWQDHVPQLRPTAGYPQDASRFLRETAPAHRRLSIDNKCMIRER